MNDVVIASYCRSPFTPAHKGALIRTRPDDLTAQVVQGLLKRSKVPPEAIEEIVLGCAFQEAEQGFNLGRMVVFLAGLPQQVAGQTINRWCGSSMQSIHSAAGAIRWGSGEAFICAGVESMTRIPMGGYNPMPHPGLYEKFPQAYMSMGETAENLAKKYAIPREDQEKFALSSHQKAAAAQTEGIFREEIVPIRTPDGKEVTDDGCIRSDTSLEKLAQLKPAFLADGTITAGTSSPLTDGASAVLVCSMDFAKRHQLEPLAKIKSMAVTGCAPEIMGIGPVTATQKALQRAGLTLDDIDLIEINEAFAAQVLSVVKELNLDLSKINLEGGAIALGHPLGASGARITGKAAQLLKRSGKRYALATLCVGGGQGMATVLEAV